MVFFTIFMQYWRCIPNKFGGGTIFNVLLFLFYYYSICQESEENLIYIINLQYLSFYFGNLWLIAGLLGYLGAMPAEEPYG
jgi:hypothetical protein